VSSGHPFSHAHEFGRGFACQKEEAAWGSRLIAGVRERVGEISFSGSRLVEGYPLPKERRRKGKERGKEKTYQLFSVSLVCSIGEGRLLGEPFGAAVTIA
jgi:hypothetical protein